MSGILRLGQHINLPSQPRMPRETSAETNDDPGTFTCPAAAHRPRSPREAHSVTLFLRAKDQVTVVTYRGKQGRSGEERVEL